MKPPQLLRDEKRTSPTGQTELKPPHLRLQLQQVPAREATWVAGQSLPPVRRRGTGGSFSLRGGEGTPPNDELR